MEKTLYLIYLLDKIINRYMCNSIQWQNIQQWSWVQLQENTLLATMSRKIQRQKEEF